MMVYLDNSATTAVSREAAQKMLHAAEAVWGNPSSLHAAGLEAEKLVGEARMAVLSALGVRGAQAKSLVFCGSGTEANNLAITGVMTAKAQNRGKRMITTDSEHPSVLEPAKKLENEGYDVVRIPTRGGVLDFNAFHAAMNENTVLVSMMLVNNETGALYDVRRAFSEAKSVNPRVVTHTDAVQAFQKVSFAPDMLCADLVTVSAHKIHGPKGVGALYIHPAVLTAKRIVPIILGGGQENGLRSGTEPVPAIAGFGEAARRPFDSDHTAEVRGYLLKNLPDEIKANIPEGICVPHLLNITLPGIRSETMLHFLSSKGIFVSSGSACSSHSGHGSYVLKAFGLKEWEADCAIRISLDDSVTESQANVFLTALEEGLRCLIRVKNH